METRNTYISSFARSLVWFSFMGNKQLDIGLREGTRCHVRLTSIASANNAENAPQSNRRVLGSRKNIARKISVIGVVLWQCLEGF